MHILFSRPFLLFAFHFFIFFSFRGTFSFTGSDILRGTPSVLQGIQHLDRCRVDLLYFPSKLSTPVVLIRLVSWGNSPLLTLLTARDVRAQNCESRFKSMILVEFLIPAFSFGCYGPGLTGVLNSRPAVFQRVIGEKFSVLFSIFFLPLIHGS